MQVEFTIYDITGLLLRTISCPESMRTLQEIPNGGGFVEGAYLGSIYWVDGGAVEPRPEQGTTVIGTTLENLPIPCTVNIAGSSYEVPDGTLELTFELPGEYPFTVQAFPYLDFKGVINAT